MSIVNEERTKTLYIIDAYGEYRWIVGVPEDCDDDTIFRAFKQAWKEWDEYIGDMTIELHSKPYVQFLKDALIDWDIMYDYIYMVDRKVNIDYMNTREILAE